MKNLTLALLLLPLPVWADDPAVESARAQKSGSDWNFAVTLSHPDSGWGHYADGWEVLDADGNRLGYRLLAHPHEHEQPFTRSLGGVTIPAGTKSVFIRAHCLVDGWAKQTFEVTQDQ